MNPAAATLLTPAEAAMLKRDVNAITGQAEAGRAVIFRRQTAVTATIATGQVVPTVRDYPVTAIRSVAEHDEGEGAQVGVYLWVMPSWQLPFPDIGMADAIVDGSDVYQVLRARQDPTGTVLELRTRREGVT